MPIPSILCPIDFSEPSRSALSYAAAIADHFGARLTVITVDDPLLSEAADIAGIVPPLADETRRDLRRFCEGVLAHRGAVEGHVEYRVVAGKPAPEILRAAHEMQASLVVMSSRGRSGLRKLFFGSTTERVLRETTVPVLITPPDRAPVASVSEIARHIYRVLTPLDLTAASSHQLTIAHRIAEGLSTPLLVAYVVEPISVPSIARAAMAAAEIERRTDALERLSSLTASLTPAPEITVLSGEPSEEIVALADARRASLIVMGLHSSGLLGPRMGSVTYRVLSQSRALVLAIPPKETSALTQAPEASTVMAHDHSGVRGRGTRSSS